MEKINKIAILLINFNLPDLTNKLVEQIKRNIKFPYELFLLDNGSEPNKRSKYATHILEKNIGLNGGIEYLYNIVKNKKEFDAYWFLCNDIELEENIDYLSEIINAYDKLTKNYKVAMLVPSYFFKDGEPVPDNMKRRENSYLRPAVWVEWNAIFITKNFMQKFFKNGFGLKTRHAFHDVVSNFIAWKNGYGCFIMDNLSIRHLGNQTFLKHGGKTINGIYIPDYKELQNILEKDMEIVVNDFKNIGINILREREKMHIDIDIMKNYEKYLIKDFNQNFIQKTKIFIQIKFFYFKKIFNKLKIIFRIKTK